MGSYQYGYKSPIWVITIVTLPITPLITTHEPQNPAQTLCCRIRVAKKSVEVYYYQTGFASVITRSGMSISLCTATRGREQDDVLLHC